ncbi:UDP-glucose 4-epimerase family protein [Burkholderia oklahomensis]|nr:SDR family oxidoreductase [Burkholderia oklahomensis]AOI44090.1 NAD-dependent dehydratase [Burkholderia oklahomensis EO147]KUY64072.1 NAD-dependent dehydratase [Burkholderia oklahomensis EO147]QPS36242.1 SDR family oxidoreductase [Burkholderia oklahomensis]
MSRIIVTGANGFVGRALCRTLLAAGHEVVGIVRREGGCMVGVIEHVHDARDFDNLGIAWPIGLEADCLIHLAARVHVMHDDVSNPDAAFRATNVEGTLRVARAAHEHGVARFVFLSSIKALAETDGGIPLREDAVAQPEDAYGRSKLEAERALIELRNTLGLDTVIVRPPLVFGPDVRANFASLMSAVSRGVPLPLRSIKARRSLVYVDNLADALMRCATDPRARHGEFHVADEPAMTVAALLTDLGRHLGRPARLVPMPVSLLRAAGRLVGRSAQVDRLTTDLRVDSAHIREVLGWREPYSLDDGLAETARWFRTVRTI